MFFETDPDRAVAAGASWGSVIFSSENHWGSNVELRKQVKLTLTA